jgi:hypothetical protein
VSAPGSNTWTARKSGTQCTFPYLSPRNIKMAFLSIHVRQPRLALSHLPYSAVFDRAIELARNTVPASWRDILGTARGPAQRHFRNCLYEFLVSLASDQSRHPFQNRHWVNFRRNSEPRNRTLTLRLVEKYSS